MSHEKIGKSNEYYTPKYIFDAMKCQFNMDVASPVDRTHTHVPAEDFITEESLSKEWKGCIWMNPPFGGRNGKKPWLDKFFNHGNGVALVPDSTSAPWWQEAANKADAVLFVSGKIKFIRPDGTSDGQPSNGTCLFASGDLSVWFLENAEKNGLGKLFYNKK